MRTLVLAFLSLSLLCGLAPATQPAKLRIVLVGDSTVTDKNGWGRGFARAFDPDKVEVINTSAGGRSSKSFRDEGKWDKAIAALSHKGDIMLIQFGHNDEPGKGPQRETDPNTTFKANMIRYVQEAQAAGFRPILVTSLVRRRFQPDGTFKSELTPYANATTAAAAETHVPVIDLHTASIALFEKMGREECESLSPKTAEGKIDATHLKGDEKLGTLVGALMAQKLTLIEPSLSPALLTPSPTTQP